MTTKGTARFTTIWATLCLTSLPLQILGSTLGMYMSSYFCVGILLISRDFFFHRLNARPTFFGCNATDVTNHDASHTAPVIGQYAVDSSRRRQRLLMSLGFYDVAYIPAYPWSAFANTSEDKLQYSKHESRAALDNGMHSATLNNTVCYTWRHLILELSYRIHHIRISGI